MMGWDGICELLPEVTPLRVAGGFVDPKAEERGGQGGQGGLAVAAGEIGICEGEGTDDEDDNGVELETSLIKGTGGMMDPVVALSASIPTSKLVLATAPLPAEPERPSTFRKGSLLSYTPSSEDFPSIEGW